MISKLLFSESIVLCCDDNQTLSMNCMLQFHLLYLSLHFSLLVILIISHFVIFIHFCKYANSVNHRSLASEIVVGTVTWLLVFVRFSTMRSDMKYLFYDDASCSCLRLMLCCE